MTKPYSGKTRSDCFMGTSHDFATFDELFAFATANQCYSFANQDQADEGFDGLTEDERDQLNDAYGRIL